MLIFNRTLYYLRPLEQYLVIRLGSNSILDRGLNKVSLLTNSRPESSLTILIFKMIFCFLKTKSVENILMYLGGYFLKILRGNSFDKIFEIVRNVRSHFHLRQQKIKLKTVLYGKTRALCKRMFCYIFWQYFYIVITFFAAHSITISNLHLLL